MARPPWVVAEVGREAAPTSSAALAVFAEVVVGQSPATEAMTLRLRGGRELVLPASMSAARIAELLRAMEGAAS